MEDAANPTLYLVALKTRRWDRYCGVGIVAAEHKHGVQYTPHRFILYFTTYLQYVFCLARGYARSWRVGITRDFECMLLAITVLHLRQINLLQNYPADKNIGTGHFYAKYCFTVCNANAVPEAFFDLFGGIHSFKTRYTEQWMYYYSSICDTRGNCMCIIWCSKLCSCLNIIHGPGGKGGGGGGGGGDESASGIREWRPKNLKSGN